VIAIAAGATTASHVNDSGFWLVGKNLGMTEKQTLQSWTITETIISVTGFSLALLLSLFF
jgi:Gnt-I system low-affinity gluconate transporter